MGKGSQKVYMPLMHGDWLKGTQGMKAEVRGVYLNLLLFQWNNGSLPSDWEDLCLIDPELPKVWEKLKSKFTETSPGYLQNKNLEEIREFWAKQKKNGKKGGRKPKSQPKVNPTDNPNTNPKGKPHNDIDIDIEFVNGIESAFEQHKKSEKYFLGDVPPELVAYANDLRRSALDSEKWQRLIADQLRLRGYTVDMDNVACVYPNEDGEAIDGVIDLRAIKGKNVICIECDNRVVTRDSWVKIHLYAKYVGPEWTYSGMILLRDPKANEGDELGYTLTQDKAQIENEIFDDARFMEGINKNNPGVDIRRAWNNCWDWHSVKPSPPVHAWEWKQKLISWLTIKNNRPELTSKSKKTIDDIQLPSYE